MKIIITERQYKILNETKSVNAAQTLIDMAVDDYIESCEKMKSVQNIQLDLYKGFKNGTVKLEVTNVEKIENERVEDKMYFVIHLILYVNQEWMLENSYYEKFETILAIKIEHFLGIFKYYCYIDEVKMIDNDKDGLTNEHFNLLQESEKTIGKRKKLDCKKCNHSWKIEKDDNNPYLCHMCGYDSKNKKYEYDKLENFWNREDVNEVIKRKIKKNVITDLVGNIKMNKPIGKLSSLGTSFSEEEVTEKWSEKYKKSINCNNPKGFSQRAHCQGKKKKLKESEEDLEKNDFDINGIKTALKVMSSISETYGEGIGLSFTLNDYYLKQNEGTRRPILQLFIDVDKKDGKEYKIAQMYRHEISVELLNIFEMMGLYNDERMTPYYNFHFNKRNLE
jgi:hypothetical protein